MDTPGQGVDDLWYMYHFLLAVTQTLTLYQLAIPIPEQCLRRFVPKFVCTEHVTEKYNNINHAINKTLSFGLDFTY